MSYSFNNTRLALESLCLDTDRSNSKITQKSKKTISLSPTCPRYERHSVHHSEYEKLNVSSIQQISNIDSSKRQLSSVESEISSFRTLFRRKATNVPLIDLTKSSITKKPELPIANRLKKLLAKAKKANPICGNVSKLISLYRKKKANNSKVSIEDEDKTDTRLSDSKELEKYEEHIRKQTGIKAYYYHKYGSE